MSNPRLTKCYYCGRVVSSAVAVCPKCENPINGAECKICLRLLGVDEVRDKATGDRRKVHHECWKKVNEETKSVIYNCPACGKTFPGGIGSACSYCGHPSNENLWRSRECCYCGYDVIPAAAFRVVWKEIGDHREYAHRVCFRAHNPHFLLNFVRDLLKIMGLS